MSNDDYTYNNEPFRDDDDDDAIDRTDDYERSRSSGSRVSPFGGSGNKSGLPGSRGSRFGSSGGSRFSGYSSRFNDDDDDDEIDDDESISRGELRDRLRNATSPFGSSKKSNDDDRDSSGSSSRGSNKSSRFGSSFGRRSGSSGSSSGSSGSSSGSSSGRSGGFGSRFGGGSSKSRSSDSSGSSSGSSRSSGSSSGGKSGSSRFGGFRKSSSSDSDKKSNKSRRSSSSSGSSGGKDSKDSDKESSGGIFGTVTGLFGGGDDDKSGGKKDDGGSSGGGFMSRFTGGGDDDKSGGKKDDGGSSGGGFMSRFTGGGDDDKSGGKKDDGGSSGGGFMSRFTGGGDDDKSGGKKDDGGSSGGGFMSRFTGGGDDDKSGGKKDDGGSSGGGFMSRFTGGGDDDKSGGKKDDDASSGGGIFGSVTGIFGGGGDDKEDDDSSTSSRSSSSKSSSSRSSSRSRSSSSRSSSSKSSSRSSSSKSSSRSSSSKSSSRSSSKKDRDSESEDEGSGIFGRMSATVSGFFSRGDDDDSSSRSRSSRSSRSRSRSRSSSSSQSRTPQIENAEGLTMDQWLDILGVGLTLFALVLVVSSLSAEQAFVSFFLTLFGQLFGWGAIGVPLVMAAVGIWLIARNFAENPYTIDPIRVVGVALAAITALVVFQYIDSFSYTGLAGLEGELFRTILSDTLRYAWEERQAGGGFIGAWLYYQLVINFTELGGVFIVIFAGVISAMLMFRVSAGEIALFLIGLWRGFRDFLQQQASKRRAERKIAAQKAAQQQQAAQPAPAMASQTSAAPQQPAQMPLEGREIRFNRGNQQQTLNPTAMQQQAQQAQATAGHNAMPQAAGDDSGGFFSFLRGGSGSSSAASSDDNGGLLGGLLSFGGNGSHQASPPVNALPEQPLPMDDDISYSSSSSGQRPAAQTSSNTIRLGDYLKPGDDMPPPPPDYAATGNGQQAQGQAAQSQEDTMQARQARLDALRRGETGPLSQANIARAGNGSESATESDSYPAARETAANQSGAFGRPDDRITHASENLPYQQTQGSGTSGSNQVYQQHLADEPQKAQSSRVMSGRTVPDWKVPDYTTLLSRGSDSEVNREHLLRQAKIIEETLVSFGSPGRVVEINTGPVITQFGVEPDYQTSSRGKKQRVKVSAIAALDKDLQLALGARSIRVEAPVPGKGYVGVEVPNEEATLVSLRDVIDSPGFAKHKSPLGIALGQNVAGAPISADLSNMPHLLIAGTTGSGKSVCVNSIITSIISRHTPDEVKFIMVDPKRVELIGYNGIPHLVSPVVVDLERIVGVLKWVTREMDARYKKFSDVGARNIEDFNKHRNPDTEDPMPYMVVIIDELADLMMMAPDETQNTITRIAALARATGIHLVIATQRPSVDVVTGQIKANFPARIAFAVASGTDSRVILDQPGAERLLGKGDMLYLSGDSPAPVRLQGTFVSDMEITNIVRFWKTQARQQPPARDLTFAKSTPSKVAANVSLKSEQKQLWNDDNSSSSGSDGDAEDVELTRRELTGDVKQGNEDELYDKAVALVRKLDKASISLLQRRLRIGYTRAARLIDVMEARNVVGPEKTGSSKPRDVLPHNEDT